MNKSKDQKTKKTVKPEVFNLKKEFVKVSNTYDDTNYVYDGSDDTINTEAEMKKKFSAQDNYKLLTSVANQQEKKEFREIERKYKKKNPIEPRTEQSKGQSTTGVPLDVFEFPNSNYEDFKSIVLLLKTNGINALGADEQLSEKKKILEFA